MKRTSLPFRCPMCGAEVLTHRLGDASDAVRQIIDVATGALHPCAPRPKEATITDAPAG